MFLTPATGDMTAVLTGGIEDKVKSLVVGDGSDANTMSTGDKTAVPTHRDRSSTSYQ